MAAGQLEISAQAALPALLGAALRLHDRDLIRSTDMIDHHCYAILSPFMPCPVPAPPSCAIRLAYQQPAFCRRPAAKPFTAPLMHQSRACISFNMCTFSRDLSQIHFCVSADSAAVVPPQVPGLAWRPQPLATSTDVRASQPATYASSQGPCTTQRSAKTPAHCLQGQQ